MRMIVSPRGAGKTTEAIKIAAENFAYIVCHSLDEAYRVAQQARAEGLDIPFPLTFDEFVTGAFCRGGRGVRAIIVDNVDMLLALLAQGVPVLAATALGEPPSAATDPSRWGGSWSAACGCAWDTRDWTSRPCDPRHRAALEAHVERQRRWEEDVRARALQTPVSSERPIV